MIQATKILGISSNKISALTGATKSRNSIFRLKKNLHQVRTFSQTLAIEKNRIEEIDFSLLDNNRPEIKVSDLYLTANKRILFNNYDNAMNQNMVNFEPIILNKFYLKHNYRLEEINNEYNNLMNLLQEQSISLEDYSSEIDNQCLTLFLREHKFLSYKKNLILDNPLETGLSDQNFNLLKEYLEKHDCQIKNIIDMSERIIYGEEVTDEDSNEDSDSSDEDGEGYNGDTNIEGSSGEPPVTSNNESINNSLNIVPTENTNNSLILIIDMDNISGPLNDIILNPNTDNALNFLLNF